MGKYRILIKKSVKKDLKKIQQKDRNKILEAIGFLTRDPKPSGIKQLRGMDNLYRIRVGEFRIVYQIINEEVTVVIIRVGQRRSVYRA